MSIEQTIITVIIISLATILTRFLPFMVFPAGRPIPKQVEYLGEVLPYAVIGLLMVYCLKGIVPNVYPHGMPELLSIIAIVGIHIGFRNTLLSIAAGTVTFMLLSQFVF